MPEYLPLTQEEKDAIIARHHFIVDQFNQILNPPLAYEDESILQKLEDPKTAAVYRMFEEHKRREAKRTAIMASMAQKYGVNTLDTNPMNRTIRYCLRLGDDPKDIAYNEKLYQEYLTNPDKIVYREYEKLLEMNPKEHYDISSDKQAMAEFYMENTSLCAGAFAFQSIMDTPNSSKEMRGALNTLKKPLEGLNEYGNVVKTGGMDGIACPTLTPEQAAMAMAHPMFVNQGNPDLNEALNLRLYPVDDPKSFFQKFVDYGLDINEPGFLLKYKAVETDPTTGKRKDVSFDEIFENDKPNVRIEKRSKEEIFQIRAMNRAFQDKYASKFQARVAAALNQRIFDVGQIEDDHKGGWVERKVLHSTSPEWTAFMKAFKEFNDPAHPNYLRKDVLRPAAQAYRDHQRQQGYNSLEDMKGTPLKRGTLTQTVIDVCDELDQQEAQIREDIEIEINTGLQNGKVGLIINAAEVDVMEDGVAEPSDLDKGFVLEENEQLELD